MSLSGEDFAWVQF